MSCLVPTIDVVASLFECAPASIILDEGNFRKISTVTISPRWVVHPGVGVKTRKGSIGREVYQEGLLVRFLDGGERWIKLGQVIKKVKDEDIYPRVSSDKEPR